MSVLKRVLQINHSCYMTGYYAVLAKRVYIMLIKDHVVIFLNILLYELAILTLNSVYKLLKRKFTYYDTRVRIINMWGKGQHVERMI